MNRLWTADQLIEHDFKEVFLIEPVVPLGGIIFLSGKRGIGKALDATTPIPIPSGWTTIGELRAGDFVFSANGLPTKVLAVSGIQHDRACYRITFSDGATLVADSEHLWSVRRRNPVKDCVVTTRAMLDQGLRTSNYWRWAVSVPAAIELPDADLPLPPYELGLWLGDGSSDAPHITMLRADWEKLPITERWHEVPSRSSDKLVLARLEGWLNRLRESGLLRNKHIPSTYLRASRQQRLALLRGLMDTDGYCSPSGYCEYTSTSRQLANGVLELLLTLGVKATLNTGVARLNGRDCGEKYRLVFRADFSVFCLPRKAVRQLAVSKQTQHRWRSIVSIEPVKSRSVCCIKVAASDGVFLVGRQFIPTHNSHFALTLAACLERQGYFFGRYPVHPTGPVIYVGADMPPALTKMRLMYARSKGYHFRNTHFFFPKFFNLLALSESSELVHQINDLSPCLVIWDTLRKIHQGSSNEDEVPSLVYGYSQKLFPTATHLFIHHEKKTVVEQEKLETDELHRGSGAWIDDADSGYRLVKVANGHLMLEMTKFRSCDEQPQISLTLNKEALLLYASADLATSLAEHWTQRHPLGKPEELEHFLLSSFVGSPRIAREISQQRGRVEHRSRGGLTLV